MITVKKKGRGWEGGGVFIGEKDPGLGPSGHITLNAQTWTQDVQQRNMSTFRFQARYALLTYAQCGDLDPFAVVNHLAELGAECIIGRENHSDGGLHLHAFVDFGRKYRTRNTRAFDVQGCHPNVSPSRGTPEEGFDYAIKDGDVVAGDSNDLLEADWLQLVMCGLKSSTQKMSQSFGRYANHWLHVHWSLNSHNSEPSLPGSSCQSESRMKLAGNYHQHGLGG